MARDRPVLQLLGSDSVASFATATYALDATLAHGRVTVIPGALDMGIIGWIVVGSLGGAISGALLGGKTARGCLPNIVVGIAGGVVGGWLAHEMRLGEPNGSIAAVLVAVLGSLLVRLVLNALADR